MSILRFGKDLAGNFAEAGKKTIRLPKEFINFLGSQGSRRVANMQNPPVVGNKIDYAALNEETEAAVPAVQQQPGMGRRVLTSFLDYAKSPEGQQQLIDLASLAVASGQSSPYVSGAIARGVQERIKQRPILEQQRLEREQAAAEEKRAQEAFNLSQKLGLQDLGAKKLDNTLKQGLIEDKLKEQKIKVEQLELDLEKKLKAPTEKELMKKEAYNKAYSSWLTKVNDPTEASFRARMQDSNKVLTDMEGAKTWSIYTKSLNPNKIRQRKQAEVNFLTAVLRRESGASINPDEFVSARKVYFPQIGDSKDLVKQKQQARQRAFQLIEPKMIESESIQENATYIGEI
jgi:hypothetical protein